MAGIDFDRSGVSLQTIRVNLGPSIGWVDVGGGTSLSITTAGTIALPLGISLVKVNVNGAVTINLPSARGVLAIPASFAIVPVTIVDIGGFADAHPITINAAPGEAIANVTSIQIATKRGAVTLRPNITSGQWNVPG